MTDEAPKKPAPKAANPDEIAMAQLRFHGSRDMPNEQNCSRLTRDVRQDRPQYEIHYLPRIDKYRVREFKWSGADGKPEKDPHLTFLVPGDWGVGVLEGAS